MPIQSRSILRRKRGLAVISILYLLASLCLSVVSLGTPDSAQAAAFANPDMEKVWNRTDKQVANGSQSRTWLWGPEPFTGGIMEAYEEAPGGQRLVQYFDKSRMEITRPNGDKNSAFYVTNGLIARELMSGQLQIGDNRFLTHPAAQIGVAGDPDDTKGPTYEALNRVAKPAANDETGILVAGTIDREGNVAFDKGDFGKKWQVSYAHYEPTTKQNIAGPFWTFLNTEAQVLNPQGQVVKDKLFNPTYYATGLPITGAYWAQVKVAGQMKDVLIQAFERRVLTFTPANQPAFQVEMGNIGRHYYQWRTTVALPPVNRPAPDPILKADPLLVDLLEVYAEAEGDETAKLKEAREFANLIDAIIDEDADEVSLDIQVKPVAKANDVTQKFKMLGGSVDDTYEIGNTAYLLTAVPLKTLVTYKNAQNGNNFLRELASTEGVTLINLPDQDETQGLSGVNSIGMLQTLPKNEGVQVMGADKWHAAGFKGKGVKVGIIDSGYKFIDELKGKSLPDNFTVTDFGQKVVQQDSINDGVHGTAVAEIIYSVAPEAELVATSIKGTDAEYFDAIKYLIEQKVNFISISMGDNSSSEDGNSTVSRYVEQVNKETGIVFFIAAGNEGAEHYAANFNPTAQNLHQWQPGAERIAVSAGAKDGFQIIVRWDQFLDGSTNPNATDFDVIVEDAAGKVLGNSDADQRLRPPLEQVSVKIADDQKAYVKVKLKDGTAAPVVPVRLHLFVTKGARPEFSTPVMSVGSPGDSRGAIAVGAVDPPLQPKIAIYSSQGPLSDGRLKPQISAPSNVGSPAYGFNNGEGKFNGTSAATPQVSGLAALVKGANPSLTSEQVAQILMENAKPAEGLAVPNTVYGYGQADLSNLTPGALTPKGTLAPAPNFPNPALPVGPNPEFPK